MATTERITITLSAELVAGIARFERNRSRFLAEAVANELVRRRREGLLRSLENPHPDAGKLADTGFADWGAVLSAGDDDLVDVKAGSVGLRRAELEGSLPRMKDDPALMAEIVQRYAENNPGSPPLVELRVIVRVYQLAQGKETGEYEDHVEAVWTAP